jgi:sigma-E factor negative regulatory protein RseA
MNEELDSQLSAMFDDELPAAECELLARRLSRDEQLKARWGRYAVIGAAIRAERGVRLQPELALRVRQVIRAEPALTGGPVVPRRAPGSPWWQPLASAAVAATVATAAVLFLRSQGALESQPVTAQASVPALPAASHGGASHSVSYRVVVPSTQLANYFVAHYGVSSPVTSHAMLSAFVTGDAGTASTAQGSDEAVPVYEMQDDEKLE